MHSGIHWPLNSYYAIEFSDGQPSWTIQAAITTYIQRHHGLNWPHTKNDNNTECAAMALLWLQGNAKNNKSLIWWVIVLSAALFHYKTKKASVSIEVYFGLSVMYNTSHYYINNHHMDLPSVYTKLIHLAVIMMMIFNNAQQFIPWKIQHRGVSSISAHSTVWIDQKLALPEMGVTDTMKTETMKSLANHVPIIYIDQVIPQSMLSPTYELLMFGLSPMYRIVDIERCHHPTMFHWVWW